MATRSFSLSLSTSRRIACFTSGNRSAGIIEPETSRRKTRLLAGRFSFATSRPFNPIRNNRWVGSHGHAVASRSIENGLSPSGSLAWNIQKKNEGARRPFSVRNLASFQSNPQQPMGRLPRARRRVEIDRERLIALWLFSLEHPEEKRGCSPAVFRSQPRVLSIQSATTDGSAPTGTPSRRDRSRTAYRPLALYNRR